MQILGMTLIVIGLVGFLVGIGGILYHLFRAEYGSPRQAQPPRRTRREKSSRERETQPGVDSFHFVRDNIGRYRHLAFRCVGSS